MDRLHEMMVFLAVAEEGGFAAAGRRLNMSAPTITRAVAALERRIGALLVVRTTRSLRLTEVGQRYARDCRRILDDIQDAEESAAGANAQPRGSLAVTAPAVFGEMHVMPVIVDYLQAHPTVVVKALLVDRVVSVIDEGMDVAVRIGELPDSSLTAVRVGQVRRVVCASPGFLAEHGAPRKPDDLARLRTITVLMEGRGTNWRFAHNGQRTTVGVQSQLTVTSFRAAVNAAVQGAGLTQVVSYQVAPFLADGRLRLVLTDHELPPLPVHVVYAEGRKSSAKVRSFVDFCVERLRAALRDVPA